MRRIDCSIRSKSKDRVIKVLTISLSRFGIAVFYAMEMDKGLPPLPLVKDETDAVQDLDIGYR